MATNNGTPVVQNDTHTHSFSDSEVGALNTTNRSIVVVINEGVNK